jgi:hypothetical protein
VTAWIIVSAGLAVIVAVALVLAALLDPDALPRAWRQVVRLIHAQVDA